MGSLNHGKGKRSQRSLRSSSEVLKQGELLGLAKVPFRRGRKQNVVLTNRVLYWSGGGIFRREHGVIALKDVLGVGPCAKKHAASGLELSSCQHPRQVFVARSGKERDEWVAAIDLAVRAAQASDTQPTHSHKTKSHNSHYKKQNSLRGKSRPALVSPPAPPLPRVRQVTCESGEGEVVVWRGRDVSLLLQGLQRSDEVLVWVEGGAHARVGGARVDKAWPAETRVEVPLSDGSGSLSLGWSQEEPPMPLSSVLPGRVAGLWAGTLLACVLVPLWACVLCVAYGLYLSHHEVRRAQQALGRVRLTVHGFQARVKEVSVVSAGGDGPTQRLGAWEPGPSGIPPLFVSGCVGDLREARDKWEAARQWRHEFQIDKVLERPHPLFDVLSKHWTLVALPNARNGDAVFLDRVGRLWMRVLTAQGINKDDVLHHLVFLMEFALVHLRVDPSVHHQIFVYDLDGVSVRQLDRTSVSILTAVARLYQQRYTGHDRAVLFINAPATFPIIWRVIGSFVQTKRNNIHVAARGAPTLDLLSRFLHHHDIPSEYGGGLQLPNGLDQDRHLLPTHAKLLHLVASLKAAHPHATTHMPVV